MTIEIGSLVVCGAFGSGGGRDVTEKKMQAELARPRRDLRGEMCDMQEQAERRRNG